jgi:hypothetical protein
LAALKTALGDVDGALSLLDGATHESAVCFILCVCVFVQCGGLTVRLHRRPVRCAPPLIFRLASSATPVGASQNPNFKKSPTPSFALVLAEASEYYRRLVTMMPTDTTPLALLVSALAHVNVAEAAKVRFFFFRL